MAIEPNVLYNVAFGTGSTAGGPRIDIDYRTELIQLTPAAAPFISFMLNINTDNVQTHEFRAFEERPNPQFAQVATPGTEGAAGAAQTIVVASGRGKFFVPGNLIRFSVTRPPSSSYTNIGLITAISTDTLTVYPNDKTKILVQETTDDVIHVVGNSWKQGSNAAKTSMVVPDLRTFYTHIFQNTYQVPRTAASNRTYGIKELQRNLRYAQYQHKIDQNRALYYSTGQIDTSDDQPRSTLTGLDSQIQSDRVFEYGSVLEEGEFFDAMTTVHEQAYGEGNMQNRLVLSSSAVISDINKIALAKKAPITVLTRWGMNITQTVWMGNRIWSFIEDPTLTKVAQGDAYIIQPRYVSLREFQPTILKMNIQDNDYDGHKGQVLSEFGLELLLPEIHAKLTRAA